MLHQKKAGAAVQEADVLGGIFESDVIPILKAAPGVWKKGALRAMRCYLEFACGVCHTPVHAPVWRC